MDATSLGTVTLSDAARERKRLADLWADHPVVLVFLRHFG